MSNQNNNIKKCSKCNINHWDLGNQVNHSGICDCGCGSQHIFKKNGQYFCFNCLTTEYPVKCHLCHKRINRKDELGKWAGNTVHRGDCSSDPDYFGFRCLGCSEEKDNTQSSYNGYRPNPGVDNDRKCRITGCPYKVSPHFEKWGVCGVHVKKCQGTVFTHWNGGYKAKHGTTQFLPCENAVASEGDFCEHCKDQTETYQQVKARIAAEEKQGFEKYKRFQTKAQNWWDTLSSSEREKECERLVENMKQGKYWANNVREGEGSGWTQDGSWWSIENGKLVSSSPYLVPIQITEEFMQKELSREEVSLVMRKRNDDDIAIKLDNNDDNSPTPNPAAPQSITNSDSISEDNSIKVNVGDSPKPNLGKDNPPEIKNNVKTIKFESQENNDKVNPANPTSEKSPNQSNNQTLIINLKEVKKITLTSEGNLVIEFNLKQGDNYHSTQTITPEQINHSQEFQKVKNHLEKNNQTSLSQQELDKIFNKSNVNSASTKEPQSNNKILVGCALGGVLILGIGIRLFLGRSKRGIKKG